jgi:hypothetical protein
VALGSAGAQGQLDLAHPPALPPLTQAIRVRLHDMIRFSWEAVSGDQVVSGGSDVLLFDADGRIRADYQFVS